MCVCAYLRARVTVCVCVCVIIVYVCVLWYVVCMHMYVCLCVCGLEYDCMFYTSTLYFLGLQELNLSRNLLSTWDEIAAITAGLHKLNNLNISENRLVPPPNPSAELSNDFGTIRTLFANKMNLKWIEVIIKW